MDLFFLYSDIQLCHTTYITEKWVFDLKPVNPNFFLREKTFFTRNSEASLAALMKAPFQFILMLTFLVPVLKGVQGNECT